MYKNNSSTLNHVRFNLFYAKKKKRKNWRRLDPILEKWRDFPRKAAKYFHTPLLTNFNRDRYLNLNSQKRSPCWNLVEHTTLWHHVKPLLLSWYLVCACTVSPEHNFLLYERKKYPRRINCFHDSYLGLDLDHVDQTFSLLITRCLLFWRSYNLGLLQTY